MGHPRSLKIALFDRTQNIRPESYAKRNEESLYDGKDLWNRWVLSLEWTRDGVTDDEMGETTGKMMVQHVRA